MSALLFALTRHDLKLAAIYEIFADTARTSAMMFGIILGDAETQIAAKFAEAANAYRDNPVALHLRAMNMLYEAMKEKGAMVVVPSSAVETMGLGDPTGHRLNEVMPGFTKQSRDLFDAMVRVTRTGVPVSSEKARVERTTCPRVTDARITTIGDEAAPLETPR